MASIANKPQMAPQNPKEKGQKTNTNDIQSYVGMVVNGFEI
jgi:hypothetical protein